MDATALADELLRSVPANRTLGIRVESAVDGRSAVAMDVPTQLTNIVGSLHASGLAGLVDACGLTALISAMPDADTVRDLLPLGRAAQLQFLAPARESLRATCELTPEAWADLARFREAGKARLHTEVTIVADDVAVCCGRFEWSLRSTASA